jgi:peptide/nickel transport system ATP-binding protein/oligopeptide transport system ATP-binding protein
MSGATEKSAALLSVQNLRVEIKTRDGVVPVIDDLSFDLAEGGNISFVGESGCGKSMTALALMGLLPQPAGRIAGGKILFDGEDLSQAHDQRLREIRGNDISMIFQEPMTSLNPVYTIGEQIAEVLRRHQHKSRREAHERAIELLDSVHIPSPAQRVNDYPHQLSGGQRQRVMIAMALACKPRILIADEPTTALDVTVQAQIFDLLSELREVTGTAIILITHDMGAVAQMSERMVVMYAGRKAEEGRVRDVIRSPRHPYTKGLISAVPHLLDTVTDERPELMEIPGIVPPLAEFGRPNCLFASRCHMASDQCRSARPDDQIFEHQHSAACFHADEMQP